MKDRMITEIQTVMAQILTTVQVNELRRVLTNCFHQVEITPKADSGGQQADNAQLLKNFCLGQAH